MIIDQWKARGFTVKLCADEGVEEPDWGGDEVFLVQDESRSGMGRSANEYAPHDHVPWGEGSWGECGPDVPEEDSDDEDWQLYCLWRESYDPSYQVFPVSGGNAHGPGTYSFRVMSLEETASRWRTPTHWVFVKVRGSPVEALAALGREEGPGPTPEELCRDLLERYETWAQGSVCRVDIEDDGGHLLESCGGFYSTEEAKKYADETVAALVEAHRPQKLIFLHTDGKWVARTVSLPLWVSPKRAASWVATHSSTYTFERGAYVAVVDTWRALYADTENKCPTT